MKKFLFLIVIFVLLSFAACADTDHENVPADTSSVPVDTDRISVDAENVPADTGGVPVDADGISVTRGGMFCTADLPEGEVLTVSIEGDFIVFDDIDDMMSLGAGTGVYRDYVVRVEVLDERVEWRNANFPFQAERAMPFLMADTGWDYPDQYEPCTIFRVRVLEVFQGEVEVGDILEVGQSGGQIDNVHFIHPHFLQLTPGDDLVLFLASFSWLTNEEWPASLMSRLQGTYRFPSADRRRAFHSDEDLATVYQFPGHIAYRALSLTLDDLADMQIENFGRVSESFEAVIAELEAR